VFIVEVWNLSLGLISESTRSRIEWHASDGLANLIYRMWEQRHPKRDALVDVPDPPVIVGQRWAEFRINASTSKSYDTRCDDRPARARAGGMTQAVAATCNWSAMHCTFLRRDLLLAMDQSDRADLWHDLSPASATARATGRLADLAEKVVISGHLGIDRTAVVLRRP